MREKESVGKYTCVAAFLQNHSFHQPPTLTRMAFFDLSLTWFIVIPRFITLKPMSNSITTPILMTFKIKSILIPLAKRLAEKLLNCWMFFSLIIYDKHLKTRECNDQSAESITITMWILFRTGRRHMIMIFLILKIPIKIKSFCRPHLLYSYVCVPSVSQFVCKNHPLATSHD